MGAFAVWGGPILSPAWTEEIQARGGVCLGCPAVSDAEPSVFGIVPSARQTRIHLVEYLDKKLNGKPAIYAGDESMHETERVFGQLYIATGSEDVQTEIDALHANLDDAGIEDVAMIGDAIEPGTPAEQTRPRTHPGNTAADEQSRVT